MTAFEARLAEATQAALDSVLHRQPALAQADLEQLRIKEFRLAHQVIQESHRWLQLAADPRRRSVSLAQICRLTELAFKLGRLAAGLPTGDAPRRRRKEEAPGYWTGPSAEEALEKIYGDKSAAAAASPAAASVPGGGGVPPATAVEACPRLPDPPPVPRPGISPRGDHL